MHRFIKITTLYITLIFLTVGTDINAQSLPNTDSKEVQFQAGLKRLDSINSVLKETQNLIISQRLEQANETISNQSAIISSFGNIYTVISIFIAIIAIALPILMYLFGIRPSQQALKEFNQNADKKFATFLLNHKKSQIDTAIKNLKNENGEIKNTAISFLSLNHDVGLSDAQINNLLEILQDKTIDNNIKDQLYHYISQVKNNKVKKYYLNYLSTSTEVGTKLMNAIKFMSLYDKSEYLPSFITFINNNPDKSALMHVLLLSFSISKNSFLIFMNDKNFIDNLGVESLENIRYIVANNDYWKINPEEIEGSYMNTKIKSTLPEL